MLLFSSDIERDAALGGEALPAGIESAVVGIGLIDAAIGTARLVAERTPAWLLFAGTCGAYAGMELSAGDIVAARDAVIGTGDTFGERMRLPSLMATAAEADAAFSGRIVAGAHANGIEVPPVRVVCTLGITERGELAADLAGDGAVENMEVFAVLRAAADIPAAAVLGVTNIVGPAGGADWRANYQSMMRRVMQLILPIVNRQS